MKYIVRYGVMRLLGVFSYADHTTFRHGSRVIVKTPRGQEAGTVRCEAAPELRLQLGSDIVEDQIVRPMTEADEKEYRRILEREQDEFERCRKIIQKAGIVMDLVRVEHLFGGERMIVYYVAEGQVDFRQLVKVLAGEFQTRIEMRQISVRNEKKLFANIGDCGRDVCCNCYLQKMPAVSIKMAKLQKATLDPTKISGHCGRLKCCLRYEYDHYAEKQKECSADCCERKKIDGQ